MMTADLSPDQMLCIPKRKRLTHAWVDEPTTGARHLYVYYGLTELCFDDPSLVPFGQRLLEADRFFARDAMTWSDGAPHDWDKVRELLDALVAEGVVKPVDEGERSLAPKPVTHREDEAVVAHRLATARTWTHRSAELLTELVGLPMEDGHLEVVVPVHRIAHPAVDTDGRQVGENNVNPRFLHLDLPTEKRVCPYAGSRFHDDKPMNVTALKLMMRHWDHVLSLTVRLREHVFFRAPPRGERLRVGELHILALAALSQASWMMARSRPTTTNGLLPAPLSSLFRIIDGVRLVTTSMMLEPDEPYRFDTELTVDDVIEYTERKSLFLSTFGVCSGPMSLVRGFLEVLMEAAPPPICEAPSLDELVGDVERATTYALVGTRLDCIVRSFLHDQDAAWHAIAKLVPDLAPDSEAPSPRASALFAALFEEAGRFAGAVGTLQERIRPTEDRERVNALAIFLGDASLAPIVDAYFARERATLRAVSFTIARIADIVDRPRPEREMTGDQLQGRGRREGVDLGARLALRFDLGLERRATSTRLSRGATEIVLRDEEDRDASAAS